MHSECIVRVFLAFLQAMLTESKDVTFAGAPISMYAIRAMVKASGV
jgi:hypothetical protein